MSDGRERFEVEVLPMTAEDVARNEVRMVIHAETRWSAEQVQAVAQEQMKRWAGTLDRLAD